MCVARLCPLLDANPEGESALESPPVYEVVVQPELEDEGPESFKNLGGLLVGLAVVSRQHVVNGVDIRTIHLESCVGILSGYWRMEVAW